MRRALLSGVLGLAVLALALATPATGKADHRLRGYATFYDGPSYGHYHRGFYGGYGRPYSGGRYIYHPEYYHWTPYRGLHSHGHYHYVPSYRYRSYWQDPYYCW